MFGSSSARGRADDRFAPNVAELAASCSRYLRARARLIGIEGRETLSRFAIVAGLALGALAAAAFGYVFICLTVVFAVARIFHGGPAWLWVAGAMALLHLVLAAGCALYAWQRVREPFFPRNIEELRKDEAWLHRQKKN